MYNESDNSCIYSRTRYIYKKHQNYKREVHRENIKNNKRTKITDQFIIT